MADKDSEKENSDANKPASLWRVSLEGEFIGIALAWALILILSASCFYRFFPGLDVFVTDLVRFLGKMFWVGFLFLGIVKCFERSNYALSALARIPDLPDKSIVEKLVSWFLSFIFFPFNFVAFYFRLIGLTKKDFEDDAINDSSKPLILFLLFIFITVIVFKVTWLGFSD